MIYFKGVICTPHLKKTELRLIHKYLVLASDGLWDVMNDKVMNVIII